MQCSRQRSRAVSHYPVYTHLVAYTLPLYIQATSTYKLQELEKQGLVVDEELLKLPHGYHW